MTAGDGRELRTHWRDAGRTRAKVAYPSRKVAKRIARRILSTTGTRRWPYLCNGGPDGCNGWHLASSPPRLPDEEIQ